MLLLQLFSLAFSLILVFSLALLSYIVLFHHQRVPRKYLANEKLTAPGGKKEKKFSREGADITTSQKDDNKYHVKFTPLPAIFRNKFSTSYSIAHSTTNSSSSHQQQTYSEYYAKSLKLAKSFLEMHDASQSYQACGIWLGNQREYCEIYMACLSIGFVPIGIYESLELMGLSHLVKLSQLRWVVLQTRAQLDTMVKVHEQLGEDSKLQIIIVLDADFDSERRGSLEVYSWNEFLTLGEYVSEQEVVERTTQLKPSDLATLIFTSGTTGLSKAVQLTHGNLHYMTEVMADSTVRQYLSGNPCLAFSQYEGGARQSNEEKKDRHAKQVSSQTELCFASYLPLAHIAEQLITILVPSVEAVNVHFIKNRQQLLAEVQAIRPTCFMGVPRVWEKMHTGLKTRISQMSFLKRHLIKWATSTCHLSNEILKCHGTKLDPFMSIKYKLARYLVIDKIKQAIGMDRCFCFVSGAGPLSAELGNFFSSIDVVIQESYGQSEGVGVVSFNQLGGIKFGTVGKPLRGMDVKIDPEDSEILIRGPAVFSGYMNDEKATKSVFTRTGTQSEDEPPFMRTGDLGKFDDEGFLCVTGRKKDIIITSGGKNISPALIENMWKNQAPVVGDVAMIGDNRPFLTAVVSLDEDYARKYLEEHGKGTEEHLDQSPVIQKLVADSMQAVNSKLSQVEKIKKFIIAPEAFSTKNGVYTDTLKVKRANVARVYAKEIESMYAPRS